MHVKLIYGYLYRIRHLLFGKFSVSFCGPDHLKLRESSKRLSASIWTWTNCLVLRKEFRRPFLQCTYCEPASLSPQLPCSFNGYVLGLIKEEFEPYPILIQSIHFPWCQRIQKCICGNILMQCFESMHVMLTSSVPGKTDRREGEHDLVCFNVFRVWT